MRLVKEAWRSGYKGLAVLLAVAWDSQLSPVDARKLAASATCGVIPSASGLTLRAPRLAAQAKATLSPRRPNAFCKPNGEPARRAHGRGADLSQPVRAHPTSKDTLGDDFRAVRAKVFGDNERRQLADFRRSGATEALAGDVVA